MLEQKKGRKVDFPKVDPLVVPSLTDEQIQLLSEKMAIIYDHEYDIDPEEPLYLITWAPDPKELPDCDFYLQHNYNVNILADFLRCCSNGIFCVEASMKCKPHYHGWFQITEDYKLEKARQVIVKVLERFGQLKIDKARSYRVADYYERRNALYYYKEDILLFLTCDPNPITRDSSTTVDFTKFSYISFFSKDAKNRKLDFRRQLSDRAYYRDFYGDTVSMSYEAIRGDIGTDIL